MRHRRSAGPTLIARESASQGRLQDASPSCPSRRRSFARRAARVPGQRKPPDTTLDVRQARKAPSRGRPLEVRSDHRLSVTRYGCRPGARWSRGSATTIRPLRSARPAPVGPSADLAAGARRSLTRARYPAEPPASGGAAAGRHRARARMAITQVKAQAAAERAQLLTQIRAVEDATVRPGATALRERCTGLPTDRAKFRQLVCTSAARRGEQRGGVAKVQDTGADWHRCLAAGSTRVEVTDASATGGPPTPPSASPRSRG